MRRLHTFALFCLSASAVLAINGAVGVKVGLGKQPGKIVAMAVTDSSGTVRFRIDEPGKYTIDFSPPSQPLVVKVQGQSKAVKKEGIATSKADKRRAESKTGPRARMATSFNGDRYRLEHPGIVFDGSGRSHTETIEVDEPTEIMLRLTDVTPQPETPAIGNLPDFLSFVAIEGGPAPIAQDISAVVTGTGSEVAAVWNATNGMPLRVFNSGTTRGLPVFRVAPLTQNLSPGLYTGNIDFQLGGGRITLPETVPVYVRILPRTATLPPTASRKVLFYPANSITQTLTVYNQNPTPQTYTMQNQFAADDRTVLFSVREFTLQPGTSREVGVQFLKVNGGEDEKCVTVVNKEGQKFTYYLLKPDVKPLPSDTTSTGQLRACTPSKLFPIFASSGFAAAPELGVNSTVEVWDDCGTQRGDAVIKNADETGALGKAVKTEGLPVGPYPTTNTGKGHKLIAWIPPTENMPEIEGQSQAYAIDQLELPPLSEDDQPIVVDEIVNATSGEPSALAVGAAALMTGKFPPSFKIEIGGVEVSNSVKTDKGILFEVPEIPNPQFAVPFNKSKSGIKTRVPSAALSFAPAAPALETKADGSSVALLKHANLDDPGDDYEASGSTPAKAGDLVSIYVTGLGAAADNDIQVLVNGVPASVTKKITCPRDGPPHCKVPPIIIINGARLFFTIPEVPSGDDSTEGGATIQVMALGVGSNIGTTSPIRFTPFPGYFYVVTSPAGRTVQIAGSTFTYVPPPPPSPTNFQWPPSNGFGVGSGTVDIDVVPDKQPDALTPLVRWDFVNWNVGTGKQQTVPVKNGTVLGANFQEMIKVTVSGGTVTGKAPDDYYKTGSSVTITANSCPSGQVFDAWEVETFSKLTGNSIAKVNLPNPPSVPNVPMAIVAKCKAGAAATVPVTVITNVPTTMIAPNTFTVGITQGVGSGSGPTSFTLPVNPGAATVTVTPKSQLNSAGNLRFDFVNWTGNGVTAPGTLDVNQPVTVPNAATTYTANFDLLNRVDGTVNGTCAVSPAIGSFVKNGSNVSLNVTPAAAFVSAVYAPGPGALNTNLTNGQAFQFVGGTLTVNCTGGSTGTANTCVAAPIGPMTWFPMDSAALPIRDISPLALTATLAPTSSPASVSLVTGGGKVGQALQLSGSQALAVPYNAVFDSLDTGAGSGFTIDAWVKRDPGAQDGGTILNNSRQNTGLNGYYFSIDKSNGQPVLYLGAYQNIPPATPPGPGAQGYEIFTNHPLRVPADGNWHFVAVRFMRAANNTLIDYWVDGTKHFYGNTGVPTASLSSTIDYSIGCSFKACWSSPSTQPGAVSIGANGVVGASYKGGLDELEFFQRPLSDAEILGIYNAGSFGKCKPPQVNVTVNTNPAIAATVGIAGGSDASGVYQTQLNGGSTPTPNLSAQDPVLTTAGNYYRLNGPNPWAPATPPVTLPATGSVTYTANYRLAGYRVTTTGCPVNLGPVAQRIQSNPDVYPLGALLSIVAAPPAGQAFQSMTVTVGTGAPTTYTTNPVNVPLTGPVTVNAVCGAATPITITLLGNPNTAPQLTITYFENNTLAAGPAFGPGSAPPTLSIPSTGVGVVRVAANSQFVANQTGYQFKDFSGPSGTIANPSAIPAPTASTTYTANYDIACYQLTVAASPASGGTVTPSPAVGIQNGFPGNCYAPGTVVTLTAAANTGSSFTGWSGDATGTNTSVSVTMNGARSVTAGFGAAAPVTLRLITAPANIDAELVITRVGAQFGNAGTNSTTITLPASTGQVTLFGATPVLTAGVYYQRQNYTLQASATPVGPTVSVPAADTTYVANYRATGYELTLGGGAGCTIGLTNSNPAPLLTSPLVIPAGAVVNLTANAPSSQIVQRIVLTGPSGSTTISGTAQTLVAAIASMSTPITATPTCAAPATAAVTVNTNPAGLGITVGINGVGTAVNSYVNSVPAGSAQVLSAPATFVTSAGVGYRFVNWSPSGPSITAPASGSITYTANYTVACWLVQWQTNPINTGTAVFTPATGVAGFPAQCYAPGTSLTVSLTPAAGRIMTGWSPHNGGPGQTGSAPYTFTLTGPTNLLANTAAATPSVNWIAQNRVNGNIGMNAVNNGTASATNVRVLSISGVTNGFAYSGTAPPFTLTPNLPVNGVHGFNLNFTRASGPANAPFSFTMSVEVSGGPPTPVTVNVP